MNILAIGDIVGTRAIEYLRCNLWSIRDKYKIDFVIANGENASEIHGLSARHAEEILDSGVDLITMGNHTWGKRDIYSFLDDNPDKIIRPVNYPGSAPGCGYSIVDVQGFRLLCINAQGQAFMDAIGDPFDAIDLVLAREEGEYDISILDFHAEATSEKYTAGRIFDGKINMIFGTHTHVQTADEQILPEGSAYITDVGMTGPTNGILGTDSERVIYKTRSHLPTQFIVADGEIRANAVLFSLDGNKVTSIKRLNF